MSQAVLKPIVSADGGVGLRAKLDNFSDAHLSMNSGTTAPSYAQVGTLWLDTSVTPNILRVCRSVGPAVWTPVAQLDGLINPEWYGNAGGTANAITVSANAFTPSALYNGFPVTFRATAANTGAVTLGVGSLTAKSLLSATGAALTTGQIISGQLVEAVYSSVADAYLVVSPLTVGSAQNLWPLGTISGLQTSRASTTTFGVAVGDCRNEDPGAGFNMSLTSAMTKSLSAWAVGSGNGALDTGTIAANTSYHVHLIRRDTDGLLDPLLSLSATAPTMPSGWTARRRIGAFKTDGSSQITAYQQVGDYFILDVAVKDVSASAPGTAVTLRTLGSVPTGRPMMAMISMGGRNSGGAGANRAGYAFAAGITGQTANSDTNAANMNGPAFMNTQNTSSQGWDFGAAVGGILTNSSAQINTAGGGDLLEIYTHGWMDFRGKN